MSLISSIRQVEAAGGELPLLTPDRINAASEASADAFDIGSRSNEWISVRVLISASLATQTKNQQ